VSCLAKISNPSRPPPANEESQTPDHRGGNVFT
jgi:hypothetical protein